MARPIRLTEAQRRLLQELCETDGDADGARRWDRRSLKALVAKGLIGEGEAHKPPQPTTAAFAIVGLSPPSALASAPDQSNGAERAGEHSIKNKGAPTKRQLLLSLLDQPTGASIADLQKAAGWQAHSVRGFLSGTVRKKSALTTFIDDAGHRRYRVEGGLDGG